VKIELTTGETIALWQALQSLAPAFRDPHLEEVLRPYCIEAERYEARRRGFSAEDDAEEEDDGWDEADRRYKRRPAPYLHRPL